MFSYHSSLRCTKFSHHRQIPLQQRRKIRKFSLVCHASLNPYKTLGIKDGSNDNDIRKAYRKLVLKYHPDVSTEDDSEKRFKEIQMAYEILTGKDQNSEAVNSGDSWDFHDWYWSFSMRKRRERTRGSMGTESGCGNSSGFNAEGNRTQVRSQLAGLKQRASARRIQQQYQDSTSTNASQQEETPLDLTQPHQKENKQENEKAVNFDGAKTYKQGLFRLLGLLGFVITGSFKSVNYLPTISQRIQTTKNQLCYGHVQFAKYLLSTYLQPYLDPFALLLSDQNDFSFENRLSEIVKKRLRRVGPVKSVHSEGRDVQVQLPNLHLDSINISVYGNNKDVNDDGSSGQQSEYCNARRNQFRQDTSSVRSQLAGLKRRAAIKERGV
eukprot:TRINITY_DN2910_c0_g1_i2.p1 TRINITY_DN2910_c0_g1~~TRINITY_DN2910_c0_g1_i2.p1  ORF type:complete len:382 (+),score=33.11 TRINITY_DN2910_c0_g1_i2:192-1337(+)